MVYLLTAFGHQALEAHEGAEGIEKARREKPDLILVDIHMPRMDGYEVARILSADPECSQIPLVAVTALAMVGDRERILSSGFSGYIAKPIEPEGFSPQVERYLRTGGVPVRPNVAHVQEQTSFCTASPCTNSSIVLFVDNAQVNIELIRSTLEPSGYKVFTAASAEEAFDIALRVKPDLILSDVHMPGRDGYEFMRMVRSDPTLAQIPFVFLSSSVWSSQERERALLYGARKFISRPIEPSVLLSELADCLRKAQGA